MVAGPANRGRTAAGTGGRRWWATPVDVHGSSGSPVWRSYYEQMENKWLPSPLVFPPKDRAPAYDQAGNMTSDGYLTYAYDAENRLVSVSDGDLTWNFLYDPMGRRVRQKLTGWFVEEVANDWIYADVYESLLVYEGWHPIYEKVLRDKGEAPTMSTSRFHWGLDISNTYGGAGGIGGLLMVIRDGAEYLPGYDGNGNVINMVEFETGNVAATFEYDAFGQTVRQTGEAADFMPFRYQSKWSLAYAPTQWLDPDTNRVKPFIKFDLYDYGLRWYHPDQGRFINRDPIGEQGGLNLYAFVGNDPVNRWDLLGMSEISYADRYSSDLFIAYSLPSGWRGTANERRVQMGIDRFGKSFDALGVAFNHSEIRWTRDYSRQVAVVPGSLGISINGGKILGMSGPNSPLYLDHSVLEGGAYAHLLEDVIRHELGHWFGLKHVKTRGNPMFSEISGVGTEFNRTQWSVMSLNKPKQGEVISPGFDVEAMPFASDFLMASVLLPNDSISDFSIYQIDVDRISEQFDSVADVIQELVNSYFGDTTDTVAVNINMRTMEPWVPGYETTFGGSLDQYTSWKLFELRYPAWAQMIENGQGDLVNALMLQEQAKQEKEI